MGDRRAQEFWDKMWNWERYERYPGEERDDPHLVIALGTQVQQALDAGRQPDPELSRRFDHCVGRVLDRLTNLLPRSGQQADLNEFKHWLRFGLDPANRGKDGSPVPIIDANSLVNFLRFTELALDYCRRHGLSALGQEWEAVRSAAEEVEAQHQAGPTGGQRPSRFG